MLLLIDAGNTRIKWALAAPGAALGAWIADGAVYHADLASLPTQWPAHIEQVVVANVAGPDVAARLSAILPTPATWFASSAQAAGLRNSYKNPAQLGCDRFAAAIGARALFPDQALIVATCGTATTIDAISADGVFLGGMIAPGLGTMAKSLARNTAQLPEIGSDARLPAGFADNTADAILSGCLAAQAGAIERACAMHGASLCLLSGGAAPFISPALSLPHRIVENIVLIGLHQAELSR